LFISGTIFLVTYGANPDGSSRLSLALSTAIFGIPIVPANGECFSADLAGDYLLVLPYGFQIAFP
jgi:hypothetical protein